MPYGPFQFGSLESGQTFSGVDIIATLRGPDIPGAIAMTNLNTVSYSIHREKAPVRRLGRVYSQGYTRGPRTIAGSMVWINFNKAALWELIRTAPGEESPVHSIMTDQLPPFHMGFTFVNENGLSAFMNLFGIEIVDEGMVLGTDEAYLETTMQYVAEDIDLMYPGDDINEKWDELMRQGIDKQHHEIFNSKEEANQFAAELRGKGIRINVGKIMSGEDKDKWKVYFSLTTGEEMFNVLGPSNKDFVRMMKAAGLLDFDPWGESLDKKDLVYYDAHGNPHYDTTHTYQHYTPPPEHENGDDG